MSHAVTVKPIYTEAELVTALERMNAIIHASPGTADGDEAEVLGTLIQAFERDHYPLGPSDPVETIRFHMDRLGLRQVDLVPYIGAKARVSEILSRKRSLTVEMIRNLHKGLGIPLESLIGN